MVLFVAGAFAPSERPRPRNNPNVPLSDGTLGYWEVLRIADEWDEEGFSAPMEFVDALACEVEGTLSNRMVAEALDTVRKDTFDDDEWVVQEGN